MSDFSDRASAKTTEVDAPLLDSGLKPAIIIRSVRWAIAARLVPWDGPIIAGIGWSVGDG